MEKIWANSGDSHFLEPDDLWRDSLPPRLAELVPRAEKDPDGEWETVHIDGMSFRRKLPTGMKKEFFEASSRAPGARDVTKRLADLDHEGIWAELVFPSLGMWSSTFRTPELLKACMRASRRRATHSTSTASGVNFPCSTYPSCSSAASADRTRPMDSPVDDAHASMEVMPENSR